VGVGSAYGTLYLPRHLCKGRCIQPNDPGSPVDVARRQMFRVVEAHVSRTAWVLCDQCVVSIQLEYQGLGQGWY
jgi:hypothetical protein